MKVFLQNYKIINYYIQYIYTHKKIIAALNVDKSSVKDLISTNESISQALKLSELRNKKLKEKIVKLVDSKICLKCNEILTSSQLKKAKKNIEILNE